MVAKLRPNATVKEAVDYVANYQKAVERQARKHSGSFGANRQQIYFLHEDALTQAMNLTDAWAKTEVAAGVIDCICNLGMMAACGFDCKSVYTTLQKALIDLAAEVQQGLREVQAREFIESILKAIEDGSWFYVTTENPGHNFAAEALGDWKALCNETRLALQKPLSPQEKKARERERAKAEVDAAGAQLAEMKKEVAAAKQKLAQSEAKEKTALNHVKKVQARLKNLEEEEVPAKSAKAKTAKPLMKRPSKATKATTKASSKASSSKATSKATKATNAKPVMKRPGKRVWEFCQIAGVGKCHSARANFVAQCFPSYNTICNFLQHCLVYLCSVGIWNI